ncbi:MAG: homocysteine S-methyltransferase family protein [bacterium]
MHARAQKFVERIRTRVVVCDGAMGTMLHARGVLFNRCFDELNLSMPALVQEIHQSYTQAGAEIIETNTFGANRFRLAAHGLAEKLRAINQAGVRLARECAGEEIWVGGAVGPLGVPLEPLGPTSVHEAREAFRRQIAVLGEAGADLIILETFSDLNEIREAIFAAREVCDLPIVAQMTVEQDGHTRLGASPETFARKLEEWGADVIGMNCSVGPEVALEVVERMSKVTNRPLAVQPNAGKPVNIEGRSVYRCSPEYMADYARRYLQAGARLIGGCCGTTPEYIKLVKNEVCSLQPAQAPICPTVAATVPAKDRPEVLK